MRPAQLGVPRAATRRRRSCLNTGGVETQAPAVGGLLGSLPWCCLLPSLVAIAGLSGAGVARVVGTWAPAMLAVSAMLLIRANYLVLLRGRGGRRSRVIVLSMTLAATALWVPRLSQWIR